MGDLITPEDLTHENLTRVFQEYFQDKNLTMTVLTSQNEFLGQNDQFQSDIKKWEVEILSCGEKKSLSFIVKTTVGNAFHKFNTRITRQFFTEIFWYKFAFPVLKKEFPEMKSLSPTHYYAYSNYEESFRPDFCDNNCGFMCRALHHKNEEGLILLENACEMNRHTGFPSMVSINKKDVMSLNQVTVALRALATFHGTWWLWMKRKREEDVPEYVESPMNIEDIENAFMKMRKQSKWYYKQMCRKSMKGYVQLAKNHGLKPETINRLKTAGKNKIIDDLETILAPELEDSKVKTMTHGDFWVNNMLFSSNDPNDKDLKVTLIDFQLMALSHPGKDLWYLLYCNVDKEFRAKHLKEVLLEYFKVFSGYLQEGGLDMKFEDFFNEINKFRAGMALVFCSVVIFVGLNPVPLSVSTIAGMKQMQ